MTTAQALRKYHAVHLPPCTAANPTMDCSCGLNGLLAGSTDAARLAGLAAIALDAFDPAQPDWPDFGKQIAGLEALRRIATLARP